jgi:hypothetical protein
MENNIEDPDELLKLFNSVNDKLKSHDLDTKKIDILSKQIYDMFETNEEAQDS